MPIIETRHLRKVFRSVKRYPGVGGALRSLFTREYEEKAAVEDVTLAMEPGELVGYIGPNGAGKSTTIKMLTGILVPTSGEIRVAGLVPHERRKENARNIGVVFGQRSQLYWDLPLRESFELLRAIYAVPRDRFRANLAHFTDILGLDEFMATPVRQLSLGQRMRGDFAAAMLHDPSIVYLDEPTIGLDVVAKEAIREFIAQVNRERGTTVILTTHDLADVERLCERIVLIDDGKVVFDGALERLRNEYGTHRTLVVTLAENCDDLTFPDTELTEREGNVVHLRFDRRRITAEQLIRRVTERCTISDVSIVEPEMEDIIRRIYLEGYQQQAEGAGAERFVIVPARQSWLLPYYEFAKVAFAREATYRFEVFTSIGSLLVRVYLFRMVWTALYLQNLAPHNLSLPDAISYSTVALLMSLILDIDQTRLIHDKLHDGSIATDFLKPISVPLYFFSDGTGEVLFHASLIVPSLLLSMLIVHIKIPPPEVLGFFFLSFMLGYVVGFLMNFILNCIAFWTLEIHAVQLIVTWITDLLGGQVIPLVFFPAAMQGFIFALPFAAIYSTPLLIYVGGIGPDRYAAMLGLQLMWIAIFALIAVVIWRAGAKRVIVQGG